MHAAHALPWSTLHGDSFRPTTRSYLDKQPPTDFCICFKAAILQGPINASLPSAGLCSLNLRQNILPDASSLDSAACKDTLQDLELRDNLLKEVKLSNQLMDSQCHQA